MKTKKMLGAIALTAALAMGTMPAFAAGSVNNEQNLFGAATSGNQNEAESSTRVEGSAINAQLNASVPVALSVVLPTEGGNLMCPDATAYKIYNFSDNAIKVIQAKAQNGYFTIVPETNNNLFDATGATASTARLMSLTLEAGSATGASHIDLGVGIKDPTDANFDAAQQFTVNNATSPTTPGSTGITLAGKTNKFSNLESAGALSDTLARIVYTIAAA